MRKIGPLLLAILLSGLAALLFFAPWQQGQTDRSAIGYRGLAFWLPQHDIAVVRSNRHAGPSPLSLSLRILPLTIAGKDRAADGTDQQSGLSPDIFGSKLYELPTLIVLPKWLDQAAISGNLREQLLIPTADIHAEMDRLGLFSALQVQRSQRGFQQHGSALPGSPEQRIASYNLQYFDRSKLPKPCREVVGVPAGAILLQCDIDFTFYLLSDPDLVNNHGLAIADNASFAIAMVKHLRGQDSRPVYLDEDNSLLNDAEEVHDEGQSYERTANDLMRFFEYPLTIIWGTIVLVVLICLWRGAYRFGPPLPIADANIELSKQAAIAAMARLLRLSGNDGRMATQFVQNLLIDRAQQIFGQDAGNQAGITRLFQYWSRRDAAAAQSLQAISQLLIEQAARMRHAELHNNLVKFRTLLRSFDRESR